MQIQSIQSAKYNSNTPVFKSWNREVFRNLPNSLVRELTHRNDTWFFRNSEFWAKLTTFFVEKFKDVPKVNVYSYGCSDGSEPFTFAMRMLSMHGEEAVKKFLPVMAKDYDKFAIEKAKSREPYFLEETEQIDINYYTHSSYDRFFSNIKKSANGNYVSINDELYDKVKFSVADISKDYKNIKPVNSIIMARNFWPYMERWWERQNILKKIGEQLKGNSYLVIGEFDRRGTDWQIDKQIIEAGFKYTPVDFVFEKNNRNSVSKSFISSIRSLF